MQLNFCFLEKRIIIFQIDCLSTDYGHTDDDEIPDSLRPKFNSHSQINFWDLDIKVQFFAEITVD